MASKQKKKKSKAPQPKPAHPARRGLSLGVITAIVVAILVGQNMRTEAKVPQYDYRIVDKMPHDPDAFTQGLVYLDGIFFESTGVRGQSSLRRVDPKSGEVLKKRDLDQPYFGEGLTFFKGVLVQLTYKEGKAFVYDSETFEPLSEFSYDGEGWGLTHDNHHFIMSDGTDTLQFRDTTDFSIKRTIKVREEGRPVFQLNELEYIKDEIWANVWQRKHILRISPKDGQVLGRINLRRFPPSEDRTGDEDSLNGIAFDAASNRLFITGKYYANIYQIELVDQED